MSTRTWEEALSVTNICSWARESCEHSQTNTCIRVAFYVSWVCTGKLVGLGPKIKTMVSNWEVLLRLLSFFLYPTGNLNGQICPSLFIAPLSLLYSLRRSSEHQLCSEPPPPLHCKYKTQSI